MNRNTTTDRVKSEGRAREKVLALVKKQERN